MQLASITNRLAGLGSDKWNLHVQARKMVANGIDVIELTIGEPDVPPDDILIDVCHKAMLNGRTKYSNGRGEPELLNALSDMYSTRTKRRVPTDQVLCFPGTQSALFCAMLGIVEQGDSVLVPDPYYATYEGVIASTGADVVAVPTWDYYSFHLRAEDLEAAITPNCRALLLNNPHNPTGAVLSASEVAEIGEVCRKHDLWIVSDEVYADVIFDSNQAFASPFDVSELADRTIVVSSISKSHAAPGFRSGWLIAPADFCEALLPLSESMLFGGQPFIADMTTYALMHDLPTADIMRQAYRRRTNLIEACLKNDDLITLVRPEAGMFMLLNVQKTGLSGLEFAQKLLQEAHVAVMPGSSFGQQANHFIRLSLTVPDDLLTQACERISTVAQSCLATQRSGTEAYD